MTKKGRTGMQTAAQIPDHLLGVHQDGKDFKGHLPLPEVPAVMVFHTPGLPAPATALAESLLLAVTAAGDKIFAIIKNRPNF